MSIESVLCLFSRSVRTLITSVAPEAKKRLRSLRTFSPCYYRTSIDIKVLTDLKPKQDFQDIQDLAGFCFVVRARSGDPHLQSGGMAASVVRDRLIANGSRSGDPDLQNENPENLANLENLAFNLTKIKK